MTFGDQTRESLRSRIGWQIATATRWSGVTLRPYAQLTDDYEHLDDERSYRAGFDAPPWRSRRRTRFYVRMKLSRSAVRSSRRRK
jgi:uncharacterized protein YhjY with autotransporter beta-barrel domain